MTRTIAALVVPAADAAPEVRHLVLPPTGPGQVRVRIRAAGVCRSDLALLDGTLQPAYPLALGHEAAGEVLETGPGVERLAPGDPVVLNWAPGCGRCFFCDRGEPWLCGTSGPPARPSGATLDGQPVHAALGLGAFAEEVLVDHRAVVGVPPGLPWASAALLGCAVLTGTGAVRNTARVSPGDTVVVVGLGAVGLVVVAAARAAGARTVLAVDRNEAKRDLAAAAGATGFLTAADTLSRDVRARTDGHGADHAVECVGGAATIRAAWRATRRGGRVTVVGMGRADDHLQLSALDVFMSARTLAASVYGAGDPRVAVPQLAGEVLAGELPLDHLITDHIGLADVPAALDRLARGEGARSVVRL